MVMVFNFTSGLRGPLKQSFLKRVYFASQHKCPMLFAVVTAARESQSARESHWLAACLTLRLLDSTLCITESFRDNVFPPLNFFSLGKQG